MLALQGDVREHLTALRGCGAEADPVRTPADLERVDALVLPGGESTTMSRLLHVFGLEAPLRERLAAGMPTLSTCAGLILLSREVLDGRPDQLALGVLDLSVRRNGYGRQVESFEADIAVAPLGVAPFRAVFIRAPLIESTGPDAEVIASFDNNPVAIAQGPHLGLCFHPEMTEDPRLHRLFLERAAAALEVNAA
ncbi:MAG TPA: pyridoxal 5'-phosphate synthase glutaminase subunit PdxT [Candidatus Dormibacteraeota bacterium]